MMQWDEFLILKWAANEPLPAHDFIVVRPI